MFEGKTESHPQICCVDRGEIEVLDSLTFLLVEFQYPTC